MKESVNQWVKSGGVDLHLHSTASDGNWAPAVVVQRAGELGLEAIALSDHDTVSGLPEAQEEAQRFGLEVVPAVEINTEFGSEQDRYDAHILGYFIDPDSPQLKRLLERLVGGREARGRKIVDRLNQAGFALAWGEVQVYSEDGPVGRPHIARALVDRGYVADVQEAFDRLLGRGRPGYVPRYKVTPEEAVKTVRLAGGLPVLAHPGLIGTRVIPLVQRLEQEGLAGLEVLHSAHSNEDIDTYDRLCEQRGLLKTGGSDCHGPEVKDGPLIGSVRAPSAWLTALKQRHAKEEARTHG